MSELTIKINIENIEEVKSDMDEAIRLLKELKTVLEKISNTKIKLGLGDK